MVAQRVVHVLETIQVEKHQGAALAVAFGLQQHLVQAVTEQCAVGQVGERVEMCHVLDARCGFFLRGNVIQN